MPGLGWLFSLLGGGVLEGIFKTFVQPFLQAYLKAKDVDLEKFKVSSASTTQLAVAVLDANVKYATVKAGLITSVLNWWPFRIVLFFLLAFCATRFCLIVFDSTYWWIFGCTINGKHIMGDACSWSIPAINGIYGGAEMQFLLFWVVAKPVDTAVSGAVDLVSKYLRK